MKLFTALLLQLALVAAVYASSNPELTKYERMDDIPASFRSLTDSNKMMQKSYVDDSGNVRTDKVYYTIYDSFKSSAKVSDLKIILDPTNGRLDSIFKDTDVRKSQISNYFDVTMVISTPLKNFICESSLKVEKTKEGAKEIILYRFTDFNMVFTDMVIKVEIESKNGSNWVTLKQIAALKRSTYDKLNNYWAVGRFEQSLKSNIKSFKKGVFAL